MIASRRGFLFGVGALLAAPAIVRVSALMPISVPKTGWYLPEGWSYVEHMTTRYPYSLFDQDFDTGPLIIQMQRRIIAATESFREIYATAGQ